MFPMHPTDVTSSAQIAEFYRQAADLLDREGWIRGVNHVTPEEAAAVGPWSPSTRPGWCSTAAVNHVAARWLSDLSNDLFTPFAGWLFTNRTEQVQEGLGVSPEFFERIVRAEDVMSAVFAMIGSPIDVVQSWNDALGRTKEEVVSALREFAASLLDG